MSQFESIDKVLKEGRLSVQKLRENSNLLEQPTNQQDTKQDDILKIKPTHDGLTGLGLDSTTARHASYNIFNFGDDEQNFKILISF